ncbi:capsule assembly Wzi family protein [Puniceicoccaceae bacterium K14]|nr:capsule assembly Wzi family protein [Puniceicoccaceae bacterium K14]
MGRINPENEASFNKYSATIERVYENYSKNSQIGVHSTKTSIALKSKSTPFRSFGYQPREEFESSVSTSWLSEWVAGNIQINFVDNPSNGNDFHMDGSYFGIAIGNWIAAIDQVDRWWGPGWDGSLILSNNARPVPAVSLTRISPNPFKNKYLNWIGPWTLNTFMGQLDNNEGEREGTDALLFGIRVETSPFNWQWLDIGLSRTAQWAGKGRPHSLETFRMLLFGEDNRVPGTNVTKETEPGNQLAGIDYRAKLGNWNIAQYAQLIGEDEEGFLPDANMLMGGIETWGTIESLNSTWRAYFEWADTRAGYLNAEKRPNNAYNIAYQHSIYREGYRRYDQSIGHSIDGDSIMRSIGYFLTTANGNLFGIKYRNYSINRDGSGSHSVSSDALEGDSLEFFGEFKLNNTTYLKFGLNYSNELNLRTDVSNSDIGSFLSYNKAL